MAVPKNATILRGAPLKAGVMLGVSPSSDPTFDVEMARATSSGTYQTIARLSPKGEGIAVVYTDILPADGFTRTYKARAVKDGWLAGDYTAAVSAKPLELPEIVPNITPLTGKAIGTNIYLSTGQTLAFGGVQTPSSYANDLTVAGSAFMPKSTGVSYARGVGNMTPTATNPSTAANYQAVVPLPQGVTVYKIDFIYQRTSASAVFRAELYSVTSTGGLASLQYGKTSTSVAGGNQILTSSSFSFTVNTNYTVVQVAMKSTAGSNTSIRSVKLYYRTPNVQVSL